MWSIEITICTARVEKGGFTGIYWDLLCLLGLLVYLVYLVNLLTWLIALLGSGKP